MKNSSKILVALAIGAVAGAIAGILFAPDKGTETRRKLSEEGKKMAEGLKNQCCKATDNLKKEMEEAGNGFA
ncbi:YtxH domain-containing protein [Paraflavitalea soli]|uniref:YtxH domain-containing protein n=1 Tax=Paraflavitalea soli TaxID=2315862 RepID=A0A3B7MLX5_9BACT|nr:YtxH domain-containing protein [Paraflavitalea soli]AXY74050.1 YtxH domain-containing protein [Paraflavitalea soli]